MLENDGGELALWSRNERPLLRYFPELRPLGDLLPPHSALDGEIVIARDGMLDFDSMQMRLHPAESRVRRLSAEIPAEYVVFDVLLWDGEPVWKLPLEERRARVERSRGFPPLAVHARRRRPRAAGSTASRRLGLDGVVAKKLGVPYLPGSRDGVVKIKEEKTADCVVVGAPLEGRADAKIATLLLGLYRDDGGLDYVGSCAVAARTQDDVAARVLPLLEDAPERRFSEPNRWGTGELEESAVRPELVVEVRYDKVQGNRFRHGTKLLRFRDDKDPARVHVASRCARRAMPPTTDRVAPRGASSPQAPRSRLLEPKATAGGATFRASGRRPRRSARASSPA